MNHKTVNGWVLLSLLMSTLVYAYPQPQSAQSQIAGQYIPKTAQQQAEIQQYQYLRQQQPQPRVQHYLPAQYQQQQQHQQQLRQQQQSEELRKFAEKQNSLKKVSLDDIDQDIQTNQIDGNTFSWTNMLGSLMQMFFANQNLLATTKVEDSDGNGISAANPWTNVIAAGLKIVTTLLGGGGGVNDGIDKVDNVSPMQSILAAVFQGVLGAKDPDQVNIMAKQAGEFINIVVNLLDALKTSFSHRSLAARNLGKKDSVSDLGLASITMLKGYVRTTANSSEQCVQRSICEANTECNKEIGGNSIFCQMGSYATSFVLERTTGNAFEKIYEAGRMGRKGEDCRELYVECNTI